MKYAVDMASDSMIYIPSFMKTGTDIQAILRFCLSKFKAVLLVLLMGFMKQATEMGSGAMIYVPSFIKTGSGIQSC
jgi:hypothetical protein